MNDVEQIMVEINRIGAEAMLVEEPKEKVTEYTQDSIKFVRKADLTEDDLHGQSHIRFVNKDTLPTEEELYGQEIVQDVHKTIRDDSFYDNIKPSNPDQYPSHKPKDNYKRRIERDLEQQSHEFLDILPEQFHDGFHNLYIAGGSIYSLYNNEPVKDYDFFGLDYNYLMQLRGYFGQFVEYSSQYIQRGMWKGYKIMLTDNAITIGRWQIITNWWGSPQEVISEFDFKHTQNWYDGSLHLLHGVDYLADKMLWYNEERSRDRVGTLLRVPKFILNGFHIRKSEHCKILQKLESEGFSDKDKATIVSYLDY